MKKTLKATKISGKPTVVFFGSGPVAAKSLALLTRHVTVEAVVTKPKPAHHRGTFPVIDVAKKLGLPTKTVQNRAELSELIAAKPFNSRLGVLIDFGIIVARDVIDYFPLGIVNSHFSILPEWRGADPISFAVLSGQQQTGVSLMLLVAAMDEGPLLAYGEYDLSPGTTTPELTDNLIHLSDALLQEMLPLYVRGELKLADQTMTGRGVSYSRKLSKADGTLDWTKPAEQLEREIRAFAGWPKSRTALAGRDVVITTAHSITGAGAPGTAEIKDKELIIHCGRGALAIDMLKPAGKKEMTAAAFIAGYGQLLRNKN